MQQSARITLLTITPTIDGTVEERPFEGRVSESRVNVAFRPCGPRGLKPVNL